MLKFLASILLVSASLGHPVADHSSESWLQGILTRSKREAGFPKVLRMKNLTSSLLTTSDGSSHFIECEAGGYPSPAIHWLKDGRKIPQSELNYSGINIPLGLSIVMSRLYLDDVTDAQAGIYSCVAENSYFSRTRSITVTVVQANENNEQTIATNQDGKSARITAWTSNTLETEGTDVRLYCRSEGSPSPTVAWFAPEGQKIERGEKYKIEENGDLTIKDLAWNHMGNYICRSENAGGNDSTSAFVYPLKSEDEK